MQKLILSLVLSSSVFLAGCIPVFLGGVAAAGYMGNQERGMKTALTDVNIKTHIKDRLTSQHYQYLTQVEVSVLQGEVLLTGVVKSSKAASEAESVARSIKGVKAVHNELFTDGIYPTTQYTSDSWLSTQLKSYMLTAEGVHSSNYQVISVNGHVYILGLAGDRNEIEAVRHLARTTKGVKQVHSYIRLYEQKFEFPKQPFSSPTIDDEEEIE